MNPAVLAAIITAAAGGVGAIASSKSASKKAKADEALTKDEMQMTRDLANQRVAADESNADPFRQQLSQAGAISKLDRMERATYKPTKISAAPGYEQYAPTLSGGFSYEKSPDLVSSAAALKRNVMGGHTAPTMTNPANYGKTSVLDLLTLASSGADPGRATGGAAAVGTSAPTVPVDPFANVPRRGGGTGGAWKGAAVGAGAGAMTGVGAIPGALIGGIKGAIDKHASTAPRDIAVGDATNVLTSIIQHELGRQPQPGEIEALLAGQGLKPGDRWVGEGGLMSVINALRAQAAPMQPSYA